MAVWWCISLIKVCSNAHIFCPCCCLKAKQFAVLTLVLTVPQNLTTTLTKLGLTKAKVMFDSSSPTVVNDQVIIKSRGLEEEKKS